MRQRVIVQTPAVDVVAMEQAMIQLQRTNSDYSQQVHDQQDVILSLRRDLAGATARLSDVAGKN